MSVAVHTYINIQKYHTDSKVLSAKVFAEWSSDVKLFPSQSRCVWLIPDMWSNLGLFCSFVLVFLWLLLRSNKIYFRCFWSCQRHRLRFEKVLAIQIKICGSFVDCGLWNWPEEVNENGLVQKLAKTSKMKNKPLALFGQFVCVKMQSSLVCRKGYVKGFSGSFS